MSRVSSYSDSFLEIFSNEKQIIVLTKEIKTGKSISIVKKTYSKSDLTLLEETKVAVFDIEKSNPYRFYTVKSPDKSKVGLIGFIAKNGMFNNYYVSVFDELGEIILKTEEKLMFENENYIIEDIALTDNAQLYITFNSRPKEEKTEAETSYLNIVALNENDKNNLRIPFENQIKDVKLHILTNGNLFIAGILDFPAKKPIFQYFNMIISEDNLRIISRNSEKINFERKYHIEELSPPQIFDFTVNIINISELEDGNISVLCEQVSNVVIKSNVLYNFLKTRGDVVSFLIDNKGVIKSKNQMEKFQKQTGRFDVSPQLLHVSTFSFTYGDKIGYLFNDAVRNYETLSAEKEKIPFNRKYGRDSGIYMITEENGKMSKTIALTGIDPAKKFLCELLVVEEDKLIVLTRDKKSAYIEIVPLP